MKEFKSLPIMSSSLPSSYSSYVTMRLIVDGQTFKLSQLGPDFLILAEPAGHLQGEAELILTIDDYYDTRMVMIKPQTDTLSRRLQLDLPDVSQPALNEVYPF